MTPLDFASSIMAYCTATGGSVTSWGRSAAHNKGVGGVPTSYHCMWLACDIVYDAPEDAAIKDAIAARLGLKRIPERGNLVVTSEGDADHDHLQPA